MPFNESDERLFNLYCTDIQVDYSENLFQSEVKDDIKVFVRFFNVKNIMMNKCMYIF